MDSSTDSLPIPRDALELLRAFSAHRVRYLVIGAHVLAYWAQPRAAGDFDLLVEPTPENAERVWKALLEFGAPLFDLSVEDLSTPEVVFQMGVAPYRIDLNTAVTGVSFKECWSEHGEIEVGGFRFRSSAAPR